MFSFKFLVRVSWNIQDMLCDFYLSINHQVNGESCKKKVKSCVGCFNWNFRGLTWDCDENLTILHSLNYKHWMLEMNIFRVKFLNLMSNVQNLNGYFNILVKKSLNIENLDDFYATI